MSKGRSEKAEKVLLRGARLNGRRKFSTHLVKESVSGKGEKKEEEEGEDKQYSARDLFRGKEGRKGARNKKPLWFSLTSSGRSGLFDDNLCCFVCSACMHLLLGFETS